MSNTLNISVHVTHMQALHAVLITCMLAPEPLSAVSRVAMKP